MDKSHLRTSILKTLKNISDSKKKLMEQNLRNHLLGSDLWKQATTIGITLAQGFEWNTKPIIETAWNEGKKVCVPKCNPQKKTLTFYQIKTYDQLESVYYNLLEPKPKETNEIGKSLIDLLIVPGIVFDMQGFRIGFGGGYYDRFLADFSNETISLVSQVQLVDHLPSESFDIPVKYILTEDGIFKTGGCV